MFAPLSQPSDRTGAVITNNWCIVLQAKLTYQDAIDKGSTALLLKEDDSAGDIFQCSLGNLPPKTEAKISFSYVIELPQEPDGKIRFTLPTVLNPRYSPGKLFSVTDHFA